MVHQKRPRQRLDKREHIMENGTSPISDKTSAQKRPVKNMLTSNGGYKNVGIIPDSVAVDETTFL